MLRTRFSTLLGRRMQAPYRPLLFMFSAAKGHPKRCRSQIRTEISFCSGNRSVPVHSPMKGFETASPRAGRGEKRRTQSGRSDGSRCPPSQFIARICRFSGLRGPFLQNRGSGLVSLGFLTQETTRSMFDNWMKWPALVGILVSSLSYGQQNCAGGIRVEGTITDPTDAAIAGAQVEAGNGERTTTDASGLAPDRKAGRGSAPHHQ